MYLDGALDRQVVHGLSLYDGCAFVGYTFYAAGLAERNDIDDVLVGAAPFNGLVCILVFNDGVDEEGCVARILEPVVGYVDIDVDGVGDGNCHRCCSLHAVFGSGGDGSRTALHSPHVAIRAKLNHVVVAAQPVESRVGSVLGEYLCYDAVGGAALSQRDGRVLDFDGCGIDGRCALRNEFHGACGRPVCAGVYYTAVTQRLRTVECVEQFHLVVEFDLARTDGGCAAIAGEGHGAVHLHDARAVVGDAVEGEAGL